MLQTRLPKMIVFGIALAGWGIGGGRNPALATEESVYFGVVENKEANELNLTGFMVELVKLGFEAEKIPFRVVEIPFNRAMKMIQAGQGADSYFCTDEAPPIYLKSPLLTTFNWQVYQIKTAKDIKSTTDLAGIETIGIAGWPFRFIGGQNPKWLTAPTSSAAVKMLAAGRANYLLDIREQADLQVQMQGVKDKIRILPVRSSRMYLCWNKEKPQAKERLDKVYKAVVKEFSSDSGKKLVEKYQVEIRIGEGA